MMKILLTLTKNTPYFLLLILLLLNSGCQLINQPTKQMISYGQYYLWLKSLNQEELQQEIVQQRQNLAVDRMDNELYLLLIHALPHSPIHNPYTAKSLLNSFQQRYVNTRYNSENLAFITMLRDQLNEQLLTLDKMTKTSLLNKKNQSKIKLIDKKILHQQQTIKRLTQQIIQLKKIEQTINEHGQ